MAQSFVKESRRAVLLKVGGAGGIDISVRLAKNDPGPITDDTVLTDLVEADYNGYAPMTSSAWGDPVEESNGDISMLAPLLVFIKTGGGTLNTVYAVYCTIDVDAVTHLLGVVRFAAGVPMVLGTDQCPVRPKLRLRGLTA